LYKRIVLKLSGEALAGEKDFGFDEKTIKDIVTDIKTVIDMGVEVSLVIGGGNFWRGRSSNNMDRTKADQIGMLATVMNAIYVAEMIRNVGIKATVQTPFIIGTMTEQFSKDRALERLESGEVVIFAAGTGHPFFSTDSITALRGAELEVDALLFAKNIDGVYDSDPKINANAKKYDTLPCEEIIKNNLKVIDLTAASLCLDQKIPVVIFDLDTVDGIKKAVLEENVGTIVTI
jgi:uridylate kinase